MFKPLETLGSLKEVSVITNRTIDTLKEKYKIIISHEQLIVAFVNCFMDAAYYKSIELIKEPKKQKIELNLFELLNIVHIVDENHVLNTTIELGRMAKRKLDMPLSDEESDKMPDVDNKILDEISLQAVEYLEREHGFHLNKYTIIFKVAEIFLDETLGLIKRKQVEDDVVTILDQFSILLDEDCNFSNIEINEGQQQIINKLFEDRIKEISIDVDKK